MNIFSIVVADPNRKVGKIMQSLERLAKANGEKVPNYDSVRRFCIRIKERKLPGLLRAAFNGGTYKDFGIKMQRSLGASHIEVQLDNHEFDCQVLGPDFNFCRPHISACVCATTNFPLGWVVTPTKPKMVDQALTIYRAILPKGREHVFGGWFPKLITDNGSEYIPAELKRMLHRLDIKHRHIARQQSPQNGSVERSFGLVESMFADDFPPYLHTRRSLKNARFTGTWEGFVAAVDDFMYDLAFHKIHTGLGQTRFEAWWQRLATPEPKWMTAEQLDEKMFIQDKRKVSGGRVTIDNAFYTHPGLSNMDGRVIIITRTLDPSRPVFRAYFQEKYIGVLKSTREFDLAQVISDANILQNENARLIAGHLKTIEGRARYKTYGAATKVMRFSHLSQNISLLQQTGSFIDEKELWS